MLNLGLHVWGERHGACGVGVLAQSVGVSAMCGENVLWCCISALCLICGCRVIQLDRSCAPGIAKLLIGIPIYGLPPFYSPSGQISRAAAPNDATSCSIRTKCSNRLSSTRTKPTQSTLHRLGGFPNGVVITIALLRGIVWRVTTLTC